MQVSFFREKKCSFGRKCKYVHDRNILIACSHFLDREEGCAHGEDCWYVHPITQEMDTKRCEDLSAFKSSINNKMEELQNENMEMRRRLDECEEKQKILQTEIDKKSVEIEKIQLFVNQNSRHIALKDEGKGSEIFEVGQLIKIVEPGELCSRFSDRAWEDGVVRKINDERNYDIQAWGYTFWNVSPCKVAALESQDREDILEILNKYSKNPRTIEEYRKDLMRKK